MPVERHDISGGQDVPVLLNTCPECGALLQPVESGLRVGVDKATWWLGLQEGRCAGCGYMAQGRQVT